MDDAVDRGLGFLEASIPPEGAWVSRIYDNLELRGPGEEERPPFVAGLGAITLATCADDPRARSIRERSEKFIVRTMGFPGLWRYWPSLPNDLDSLSVCSQAIPWHPWVLFATNVERLRTALDEQGRFRTWLSPPTEDNDVDSVVNANVVGYLALQDQNELGEAAAAWLADLIREGSGEGSSHYYPDVLDLHGALARACHRGVPALQDVGGALADRIRARRGADGGYGDTLRTAEALTALHLLGAAPEGEELCASVEGIVRRQRSDGGWPAHLYWQGPLPPSPPSWGFGSEVLDTAVCIEALVRSIPALTAPDADEPRQGVRGREGVGSEPARRPQAACGMT